MIDSWENFIDKQTMIIVYQDDSNSIVKLNR